MNTLSTLRHGAFALLAWTALSSAAPLPPSAPAASAVVNGSYTVSYPVNCDAFLLPGYYCSHSYLMRKTEPNGQWAVVSEGTGSLSVSSSAPGTYSYMTWAGVYDPWYGYYDVYSAVTTVVIAAPPAPPAPPVPARDNVLTQLNYGYEVRRGDVNQDGRTDLFVRKTSGGAPLNGTVEKLILRQDSAVNFVPVVPTPDQALVAAAWAPAPTIGVRLHDIDVDGYVDLTLANVASVISGAVDQIVYSPGQPGQAQPGGIRRVDGSLAGFVGDAMDYLYDPDYFVKNAPLYYYEYWGWYAWCPSFGMGGGVEAYYWSTFNYCYVDYYYYAGYFLDFSDFDAGALALWSYEYQGESGGMSKEAAMSAIRTIIEGILESQLGGWPMEEILGQAGAHTDQFLRRAIEVAQAILSASRAFPEHVDMDNLPPQTPRATNVIHVTGHELLFDRGHLALEYTPPPFGATPSRPVTLSGVAERWPPATCWPGTPSSECGWGKLLAELNKQTDLWYLNFTVGVLIPFVDIPQNYWNNQLTKRHGRYSNRPYASKADYNPLPNAAANTYNSNGYVRGLNGTGGYFVVPPDMNSVYPGWDRPVPNAFFQ